MGFSKGFDDIAPLSHVGTLRPHEGTMSVTATSVCHGEAKTPEILTLDIASCHHGNCPSRPFPKLIPALPYIAAASQS